MNPSRRESLADVSLLLFFVFRVVSLNSVPAPCSRRNKVPQRPVVTPDRLPAKATCCKHFIDQWTASLGDSFCSFVPAARGKRNKRKIVVIKVFPNEWVKKSITRCRFYRGLTDENADGDCLIIRLREWESRVIVRRKWLLEIHTCDELENLVHANEYISIILLKFTGEIHKFINHEMQYTRMNVIVEWNCHIVVRNESKGKDQNSYCNASRLFY